MPQFSLKSQARLATCHERSGLQLSYKNVYNKAANISDFSTHTGLTTKTCKEVIMADFISNPTHPRFQDLTDQRFGRLLVKKPVSRDNQGTRWQCVCDCGNSLVTRGASLKNGSTQSCGCYRKEQALKATGTHRLSKDSHYWVWHAMWDRCYRPSCKGYKNYGGRGIKICDRWLDSFENFLADMGRRPSPKHSIDRINNDGDYEPSNCRWATSKEQNVNRSNNHLVEYDGKSLAISEWAKLYNIKENTLNHRLRRGWTVKAALITPLSQGKRNAGI